jgi:hypothetical protein
MSEPSVQARPWQRAATDADDREVRIYYRTNPAFALVKVRLRETDERVEVTLLERPPEGAYTTELVARCRVIELGRSLGTRRVVDGANAQEEAPSPPPRAVCEPLDVPIV